MVKWLTGTPPQKKGLYLVADGGVVTLAKRWEYPEGNWNWYLMPHGGSDKDITAWQKCPEPYKEK